MKYGVLAVLVGLAFAADIVEHSLPVGDTKEAVHLQYQSAFTTDARIYRVRSTPGTLKTEMRWMDGDELLAGGRLVACPATSNDCHWQTFLTPSDKATKRGTQFGYGVNGDQFTDKDVAAYCEDGKKDDDPKDGKKDDDPKDEKKTLRTSIKGTFSTADGEPVSLDVTVSSECQEGFLIYTVKLGDGTRPLSWSPKPKGTSGEVLLYWESMDTRLKAATDAIGFGPILSGKDSEVRLRVRGDVIVARKLLKLMYGDDVIAQTTAPAYHSKE